MNRTVIAFVACAIALVACRRNDDKNRGSTNVQPLGKSIGSVATPPSALPPTCPAGFTAHATPPWCIALPKGMKPERDVSDGTMGYVEYTTDPTETLRAFFTDVPFDGVVQRARLHMLSLSWDITGEGEFASGHWIAATDHDGQGHFVTIAHGPRPFTLRCDASAKEDSDAYARNADACRSLMVP